ncbi:Uncharacterised protein [Mycobacteroides abscessus subsp. bolletii]|nr:Uncharacterised protein [Mycobacteroides abscessus]SKF62023.1 Uncharacterised protein [Mycobacteroides abscessus subsp. bolletii]SKH91118.1 Uncharacterised protein [Mycobacteroides abscessus subsp. bolletii]
MLFSSTYASAGETKIGDVGAILVTGKIRSFAIGSNELPAARAALFCHGFGQHGCPGASPTKQEQSGAIVIWSPERGAFVVDPERYGVQFSRRVGECLE